MIHTLHELRRMAQEMSSATQRLRLLHIADLHNGVLERARERRMRRQGLIRRIAECAENGKVLVVESGRDCDCVEYHGRCHLIDATVAAYDDLDNEIGQWADGPYSLGIARPSESESIQYSSRDLVMEAHENGHPHYIVSEFP